MPRRQSRLMLCAAILLAAQASATAFSPDTIWLDGQAQPLIFPPSTNEARLPTPPAPPQNEPRKPCLTTASRGTIGTWKVDNDRLYLTQVYRPDWCEKEPIKLEPPQFADWVSKRLLVPMGEQVRDEHMGWDSQYSRYGVLNVKNGIVTSRQVCKPRYHSGFNVDEPDTLPPDWACPQPDADWPDNEQCQAKDKACQLRQIRRLPAQDIQQLTPAQQALYLRITQTAVRILRDGIPFKQVASVFGQQVAEGSDGSWYERRDLPGVLFAVHFSRKGSYGEHASGRQWSSPFMTGINVYSYKYLAGINRQALEKRLQLTHGNDYTPQTTGYHEGAYQREPFPFQAKDIDSTTARFTYDSDGGKNTCYPITVRLEFFKDGALRAADPRADSQASYLYSTELFRTFGAAKSPLPRHCTAGQQPDPE